MNRPSGAVSFRFAEAQVVDGVSVGSDGELRLLRGGVPLAPERAWTSAQRTRASGKAKPIFNLPLVGARFASSEADALADYDHFFAIDTNTRLIGGETVSLASIAACHAERRGRDIVLQEVHVCGFEFRGLASNQERFAWTLLQELIVKSSAYDPASKYLIISDHAVGLHEAINDRTEPLFGDVHLARGVTLGFATSDSGQSVSQKIIRGCDRRSAKLLQAIERGNLPDRAVFPTPDGPISSIRQIRYDLPQGVELRVFRLWGGLPCFPAVLTTLPGQRD